MKKVDSRDMRLYSEISVLSVHDLKDKANETKSAKWKAFSTVLGGFLYMSVSGSLVNTILTPFFL